ncbi:VHS domain protein, partial [Protomyces lactucae-debilis]
LESAMGLFSDEHPYTAVTERIIRLTSSDYEEDDLSGLPELIEVVKIQSTGPTEASRAIRKRLKYGSHHQIVRALVLLEALVANGGKSFQRRFGDEMLLERLRTLATDPLTDKDVKIRLANMFIGWNDEFKEDPQMRAVAHLKDALPKRKKPVAAVRPPTPDSEDDYVPNKSRGHSRQPSMEASGPSTPKQPARRPQTESPTANSSNSSKNKSKAPVKVSLEKEKPMILQTIAAANQASTNLRNALKHVNKEDASFLKMPLVIKSEKDCREQRRKVLHYVAGIESEEWVGTLLQTNDDLVAALQLFDTYKQVATAPDSDEEHDMDLRRRYVDGIHGVDETHEVPPRKPTRPRAPVQASDSEYESEQSEEEEVEEEEEDENNPFGNQNEDLDLKTPAIEKSQPRW